MVEEARRVGEHSPSRDVQQPVRHRHDLFGGQGCGSVYPARGLCGAVEHNDRLQRVDHIIDLPARRIERLELVFLGVMVLPVLQPHIGGFSNVQAGDRRPVAAAPAVEAASMLAQGQGAIGTCENLRS